MVYGANLVGQLACRCSGPRVEGLSDCRIFRILSVKKVENSLQALAERSSGATDTGGFVSLSTVVNRARALLLFLAMISEKKASLAFFRLKL